MISKFATLLNKPKASATELRRALEQLNKRETEIGTQIREIAPTSSGYPKGAERARVELEGEPAELVALDNKLSELRAELAAVPPKREALTKRLEATVADDAAHTLPRKIKALTAVLNQWQTAQATADKAKAELQEAMTEITLARRALEDVKREAPGVPSEVAVQIVDALGFEKPDNPMKYSLARAEYFKRLGAPQIERDSVEQYAAERSKREAVVGREEAVDLKRHPEQSIWARPQ